LRACEKGFAGEAGRVKEKGDGAKLSWFCLVVRLAPYCGASKAANEGDSPESRLRKKFWATHYVI